MAANSKGRSLAGTFGKRFASQIWARPPPPLTSSPASASRQFVSSYDKNVEEQVRPAVVPDHVIEAKSDKYWGPNPNTGVFGPADAPAGGELGGAAPPSAEAGPSVLDQKVWYRPLEDVDKPPPHA